jgi:predicted NUDIX family NTP pyrophosphohydrolase
MALAPQKLKSGKLIYAWAVEGDLDPAEVRNNNFEVEWPPRSGNAQHFPEIDRAGWFRAEEAVEKINPGQRGFVEELVGRQREKNRRGR